MKIYKPDFNIQKLKDLPIDKRINKIIDVVDWIVNKAFYAAHEIGYIELHNILETINDAKFEIREFKEDDPS